MYDFLLTPFFTMYLLNKIIVLFGSEKTRNIYLRKKYHDLLANIKLLESSEKKKETKDYHNLKRYDIFPIGGFENGEGRF